MAMKKALRTVDNNAAYAIVNAAYKQAVGTSAVDTVDLSDFCDSGVAYGSLTVARDKFFKALLDQVVNFYTDTTYEDYNDVYYVESRRFANLIQMINVQPGDVQESHAWRDFAPNTSTNPVTYAKVGTYDVKPPVVDTTYYQKTVSWELPIAITGQQLDDAFKSAEELRGFVDYIYLCVDNKLKIHRENLNATNRNNAMGWKIYSASQGTPGIHKINLLDKYNTERGKSIDTIAEFMADADALRYAGSQILLYSQYFKKPSTLFNTKGLVKFCPADRMVLEVNSMFENSINEVALSNTFHDELASMNGASGIHVSTPAWQGWGVNSVEASTTAAAFDQVTKIDVTLDNDQTVTQSGIVAFLADKLGVAHAIRNERIATYYAEPEDLQLFFYQNRDQYLTNLAQNMLVFTLEEPSGPSPSSGT